MKARTAERERALILCVEDEPDLRADIIDELRASGHDAIGADDGRSALETLGKVRPDLILCDITMPGMNGYDLLKTVRAHRADLDDVPFVFLTALDEREAVISGKRAGADDYLVKPIDFDLMLASIETRIAQTRRICALHRQDEESVRKAFSVLAGRSDAPAVGMTTEVLDILGFGVVLVDRRGDVVFANAFARTLGEGTDGLSFDRRVSVTTPDLTRQLHAHVAEVVEASEQGRDIMRGLAVPRLDGAGEIMLVICALCRREGGDGRAPMAAIFISDSKRRPEPPEHLLESLFGLTPAEAHVAHGLVSGQRSADVARDLKISQTTVAFHLRNLFEKTGTHRQVDLVALIMNALAAVR